MARRVHIGIDASEVDQLRVDLSKAPGRVRTKAGRIMYVAANKIKKGMRSDLKEGLSNANSHLPHLPHKIGYDKIGQFDYEIGIAKGGQGNLGNVAAYGTVNNAPVFSHTASLRRETPHVIHKLAEAAEAETLEDFE